MEMGFLRGLITVVTLAVFLGICWWAYRPGNKSRFEEDAMLPFDEGENDHAAKADLNGGSLR
jgi:cytochrome c oxidase cbb3-type subunit 4